MKSTSEGIECDVLVVGGGINGAGIARDAAGRGLKVVLCEKDDLASHTSSASTKLIHGGLRYLEHFEFGLVRKALIEREVLLRSAPHITRRLRFVMPHDKGQRPAWMIRAGIFLYDHLARRELLPGSCSLNLRNHPAGEPLKSSFTRGFAYSDAWVDDARLVVLNAVDAAEKKGVILTRTACEAAIREGDQWVACLRHVSGKAYNVKARCLINAAGPWVTHFLTAATQLAPTKSLRLVKGSHIVVKRLFDHPYAYIFQHPDGRIVFTIPYEDDFTLIGTTDLNYFGDIDKVRIDQSEIAYLCELTNHYFLKRITPEDVVWSYSGVRPLVDNDADTASAVTRDYRLELDTYGTPLLSIFGGKITTYRKLAEQAVNSIAPLLGNDHGSWTSNACLPGGDIFDRQPNNKSVLQFDEYVRYLQHKYSWLSPKLLGRYARAYGTRTDTLLLKDCKSMEDMGKQILDELYSVEVRYLMDHEWATCADDILWRRSKLGLHTSHTQEKLLNEYVMSQEEKNKILHPISKTDFD
jgi:glycerol-3-phosphate dehydrogenase